MSIDHPTEVERVALRDWLIANGIDPKTVPLLDSGLRITETDGQRLIRYTQYVCDPDTGNKISDGDGHAKRQDASSPCRVEPPAWIGVPGAQP